MVDVLLVVVFAQIVALAGMAVRVSNLERRMRLCAGRGDLSEVMIHLIRLAHNVGRQTGSVDATAIASRASAHLRALKDRR